MADYQRARSPQQKAERMTAIMDAAESLFRDLPYHEINMGMIAKELGWSRSNLYKYAATQEEVFLSLQSRANAIYVNELVKALSDAPIENAEFAKIWANVTGHNSDFLRYQDILIAIIESNASLEKLVEFKRRFVEITDPVIEVLKRQTGCEKPEAYSLYLRLIYQAPGLYNHFHCAERTSEAMRLAGIPPVKGVFEDVYADFVEMCLDHARESVAS